MREEARAAAPPAPGGPVIRLSGITRRYQTEDITGPRGRRQENYTVNALRGVDLSAEAGEFIAIMGPSGSGKSTLMNILGCLDAPTTGTYLLDGVETTQSGADAFAEIRNRKIGFVFQSFNLLPRTSAIENVELPLLYRRREKLRGRQIRERAEAALAAVGLGDRLFHKPSQLYGGQQQRVAIARALVTDPAFILADEPTGNLDSSMTAEIIELFRQLNDGGTTVLLVTHEADVGEQAKRIISLKDGLIVEDRRIARGAEGAGDTGRPEDRSRPPAPGKAG
jgi:putative ABC transport system ATP-binding protein